MRAELGRDRAAGPAAARSAARRRRRRRSGRASSGSRRRDGCRSRVCAAGSPLPAIVTRPSTKSVGASGIGSGSQRSWFGRRRRLRRSGSRCARCAIWRNGSCTRRRPDAIQPRAPVRAARRGERGARNLLGVEAVGRALRRILADRQRAGQRLGRELVAEARLVRETVRRSPRGIVSRLVPRPVETRVIQPSPYLCSAAPSCLRLRILPRRAHRFAQHDRVADVVGEQQDELCVDQRALRRRTGRDAARSAPRRNRRAPQDWLSY